VEIVLPPLGGDMEWPTAFAEASASQGGHTIGRPSGPDLLLLESLWGAC